MWKESLVKVRKSDELLGRSKHQRVGKQVTPSGDAIGLIYLSFSTQLLT